MEPQHQGQSHVWSVVSEAVAVNGSHCKVTKPWHSTHSASPWVNRATPEPLVARVVEAVFAPDDCSGVNTSETSSGAIAISQPISGRLTAYWALRLGAGGLFSEPRRITAAPDAPVLLDHLADVLGEPRVLFAATEKGGAASGDFRGCSTMASWSERSPAGRG